MFQYYLCPLSKRKQITHALGSANTAPLLNQSNPASTTDHTSQTPLAHVTEAGASDRGRARTNLGLGGAAVSVVGEPGGLGPRGGRGAPASGGGGVLGLGVGARVPGGGAAVALVALVVLGHLAATRRRDGEFFSPSFSNSS